MQVIQKSFKIANGGTTSQPFEMEAFLIYSIAVPTIDSATLKIQGSTDGGTTFGDIKDSTGTQQLTWTAGTGGFVISSQSLEHCRGCTHIQFVAGASQSADRVFHVCEKDPWPR